MVQPQVAAVVVAEQKSSEQEVIVTRVVAEVVVMVLVVVLMAIDVRSDGRGIIALAPSAMLRKGAGILEWA